MVAEERQMLSLQELADRWGTSRQYTWERARDGTIPAVKIGAKWLIPMRWVTEQENVGNDYTR